MTTFARVNNGFAEDCRVHASATELAACFHPDWLAAHPFVVVPNGTIHGAKDNGDGTFTNPQPTIPVLVDLTQSRPAFVDYLVQQVGSVTRAGTIILAAKNAADPTVAAYWDQYTSNTSITKQFANKFMLALQAASLPAGSIITNQERNAVNANWPQG